MSKATASIVAATTLFAASVFFLPLTSWAVDDPFEAMGVVRPKTRMKAPDFSLETLDGSPLNLDDFKGRLVVLNFWATWCAPCREEMPSLERLWRRYRGRGLVVIGIALDRGNTKGVGKMARSMGLTFPIALDRRGRVRDLYEVVALPYTYIVGRDGKFLGRAVGARKWDGAEALRLIESLLEPLGTGQEP